MGAIEQSAPEPPEAARRVFGERLPIAVGYAELLATTGISHGLIGPRERERLWERHLLNCAAMESLVPQGNRVIDIGSGAGLPGVVLAIARPDLQVELVEPLLRRTTWLDTAVAQLGLTNVTVHRGRAEEMTLQASVATARAVASLDKLVRWSLPLLEADGRLLALKGEAAGTELSDAEQLLEDQGVTTTALHVLAADEEYGPVRVVEIHRPERGSEAAASAGRGGRSRARRAPSGRHQRRGRRGR